MRLDKVFPFEPDGPSIPQATDFCLIKREVKPTRMWTLSAAFRCSLAQPSFGRADRNFLQKRLQKQLAAAPARYLPTPYPNFSSLSAYPCSTPPPRSVHCSQSFAFLMHAAQIRLPTLSGIFPSMPKCEAAQQMRFRALHSETNSRKREKRR